MKDYGINPLVFLRGPFIPFPSLLYRTKPGVSQHGANAAATVKF